MTFHVEKMSRISFIVISISLNVNQEILFFSACSLATIAEDLVLLLKLIVMIMTCYSASLSYTRRFTALLDKWIGASCLCQVEMLNVVLVEFIDEDVFLSLINVLGLFFFLDFFLFLIGYLTIESKLDVMQSLWQIDLYGTKRYEQGLRKAIYKKVVLP